MLGVHEIDSSNLPLPTRFAVLGRMKKNTDRVGNASEAAILAALVKRGKDVLVPFGQGLPYDLVLDEEGQFQRIQVKTGVLKDGFIAFNNVSNYRNYKGLIEFFGIYCPQNGKTYMISVAEVGYNVSCLRLSPTKNGQKKGVHFAEEFEI